MAHEIIRFTLADPYLALLKEQSKEDESLHLTVKRLLIEMLDTPSQGEENIETSPLIQEILKRLERLENQGKGEATNPPNFEEITSQLEKQLADTIADRDRLLQRLGEQETNHHHELQRICEEANKKNDELEKENYSLNRLNCELHGTNTYLENKLLEETGIDIRDESDKTPPQTPQPTAQIEFKPGYIVFLDDKMETEKFWTGRELSTDPTKAKIMATRKGANSSVAQLKKKGFVADYRLVGDVYDTLDTVKQETAYHYWTQESDPSQ